MEVIAALLGALVGVGATIVWQSYQGPKRLLRALRAELAANRKIANHALEVNLETLSSIPPTSESAPTPTIDDDLKVYVSSPINIPLETWVNQDFWWIFRAVPMEALLEYKAAVSRVDFLVERHRAFRFRPNFIQALVEAHEKLLAAIESLEPLAK
jgi:hypothetical protein